MFGKLQIGSGLKFPRFGCTVGGPGRPIFVLIMYLFSAVLPACLLIVKECGGLWVLMTL